MVCCRYVDYLSYHTDVGFRLRHHSNHTAYNIRDNSNVRLATLGTLLCTTPYQHCCQNRGQWHYPNAAVVPASQSGTLLFTSRLDQGILGLQRRTGFQESFQESYPGVDGVYKCQIPDVNGRTQTLYAWIYSGSLCKLLRYFLIFFMILPGMTQLTRKFPIALRQILRGSPRLTA